MCQTAATGPVSPRLGSTASTTALVLLLLWCCQVEVLLLQSRAAVPSRLLRRSVRAVPGTAPLLLLRVVLFPALLLLLLQQLVLLRLVLLRLVLQLPLSERLGAVAVALS